MHQSPSVPPAIAKSGGFFNGTLLKGSRYISTRKQKEMVMPLFLPFLIGIPVVLGSGYLVYTFVR